jgi:hypothetical protein
MSHFLSDYAASVGCTVTLLVEDTYYSLELGSGGTLPEYCWLFPGCESVRLSVRSSNRKMG